MRQLPPPAHRARPLPQGFPRISLVLTGIGLLAGLCAGLSSPAAAATTSPLTVVVSGSGAAFRTTIDVSCEGPIAPSTSHTDIGSAARATRVTLAVPAAGSATFSIDDLTDDSACAVTASGRNASGLTAVDGGVDLVGSDGQLRGVAVTVDRGTPVTAHLTFTIPVVTGPLVLRTEAISATDAAGSGSAALAPPALPGSDGAASAAAPVALAAARSTTTASSAALPDPSGTGTALVIASIGVLLCGAFAYGLVLAARHEPHTR